MIAKIKAWIHNVVALEVHRLFALLSPRHIEAHVEQHVDSIFIRERKKLLAEVAIVKSELQRILDNAGK